MTNSGADSKAWQYFYNQTSAQVGSRLSAFNGRLTGLARRSTGRYDMIQVRNTGADSHYWRYYYGLSSLGQANEVATQFGSRVFDIESYVSGGVRYYNALMIDNANSETRRIRTAFGNDLVKPNGLPNGQWGAYLKPVATGAIATIATVSLNGNRRFEPASAIKSVHNLAVMRRIQANTLALTNPLTYYLYPSDTQFDSGYGDLKGRTPNACPNPADETTANDIATTVNFGKDNMMTVSDNRTTRAITLLFGTGSTQNARGVSGIAALESIAFNTALMTDTFMDQDRIGCGYVNSRRNQTTLADFGKLYERVENGTLLGTGSFRTEFYQPMNGGTFSGSSGTTEGEIIEAVQEEGAAMGKSQVAINDFISRMEWRHKGGGYGIGCDNPFTPCANGSIAISTLAGRLTLPRRVRGLLTERDYVFGDYVTDYNVCSGSADCGSSATPGAVQLRVRKELFRTVIRENLTGY